MKSRFVLILLTACAVLLAQSTPSPSLLILSKKDHTLSIVDPATLKVVARMPSGPDPHEVIAATDGKLAYISNYGGGRYNTITVVDLVAQKTLRAIDLGALQGPHGLDYVGGKLFFTAEVNKVIGSYDPAADKIDWIMGTGQDRTHMVYVAKDLHHIATTNVSSATVSLLELNGQNWAETVIGVGKGSEGFDITPNGKELWTANAGDGTISVIDLAAKKVVNTLAADVRGANRLKFTPDGKFAMISLIRGPDLVVLDAATQHEVKRIPLGHGAEGVLMQPDGARVYVSCTPDNYVAVIDLKSMAITGRIDAGGEPDGLAWAVR